MANAAKNMKGCLYILRCADGSYYTGSTTHLESRLAQHASGLGSEYTKTRLPIQLVCVEEYERIDDAFAREKQACTQENTPSEIFQQAYRISTGSAHLGNTTSALVR